MIAIIDYGAGNLRSVAKALDFLKVENIVTDKAKDIVKADKLIFPGVGNFGDMMRSLEKKGLINPIKDFISSGKPFLGICLGLQALFEKSDEAPDIKGLGIFKGKARKLKTEMKIPQIGWNQAKIARKTTLFNKIKDDSFFYFVHSYCVEPKDKSIIMTTTAYGEEFVSGINKDNIYAVQYHPEKSGEIGLQMLRNFAG